MIIRWLEITFIVVFPHTACESAQNIECGPLLNEGGEIIGYSTYTA
jgi:hypothetical protein